MGFPSGSDSKESACNAGDLGSSLGWEGPLEEGMATHPSILAWRILMDRGAWPATVHGVWKSQIQLRLSTAECSTTNYIFQFQSSKANTIQNISVQKKAGIENKK